MWNPPNTATIQKKKLKHPESELQQACVKWFKLQYPKRIIIAIPNGGKRSKTEAAIMKGEGVMPGVCDLFIPEPNETYPGMWIELKTGKNTITDKQLDFISKMKQRGYRVVVVYTSDYFREVVNNYFTV